MARDSVIPVAGFSTSMPATGMLFLARFLDEGLAAVETLWRRSCHSTDTRTITEEFEENWLRAF
jgi:hypothetical protein